MKLSLYNTGGCLSYVDMLSGISRGLESLGNTTKSPLSPDSRKIFGNQSPDSENKWHFEDFFGALFRLPGGIFVQVDGNNDGSNIFYDEMLTDDKNESKDFWDVHIDDNDKVSCDKHKYDGDGDETLWY